jgi:hypothetical protein
LLCEPPALGDFHSIHVPFGSDWPAPHPQLVEQRVIPALDDHLTRNEMTMDSLAEKTCTPCRGGVPPLNREEAERFRIQSPDWQLMDDGKRIERRFPFPNFREALGFVQKVGEITENEGHHPEVTFG